MALAKESGGPSYRGGLAQSQAVLGDRAGERLTCLELAPADPRWLDLVGSAESATVFHHPAWSQLMAECYGYRAFVLAAIDGQGRVAGGLPVLEVNSWLTGRRWVSLAFSDHCAPLFLTAGAKRRLIEELPRRAGESGVRDIQVRSPLDPSGGFRQTSDSVLHLMPLEPDIDNVVQRFHRMHRRNVAAAIRRGVTLQQGTSAEMVKQFYRLHLETRRRQGVPVQPWQFFNLLQQRILSSGLGFVLLAQLDGECVAGAVFLHYRKGLTYKYGASNETGQEARANNLIFDQAIRWGCQHGHVTFDMGKTSLGNTGLRSFKSRWGAEEQSLVYSSSSEDVTVKHGHRTSRLVEMVIKRSPTIVCRVAGELLYRHFG